MFDRLLIKTIGTRLVDPGNCPYNPYCIHAGHGSCLATRKVLQEKKAEIIARVEKEEPHPNIIVWLTLDEGKRWPCAELPAYVVLLPADLEGGNINV